MKYVIDIDEYTYREALTHGGNSGKLVIAVRNGEPLDSVLDKIKAEANADCISDGIGRYIRFDVLEKIINKHKAKSDKRR